MKIKINLKNKSRGFTIIESVVVMCIIGILAVTAALGYGEVTRQKNLERASEKISSQLSRARDYSIFGKEIDGKFPCGYGVVYENNERKKVRFITTDYSNVMFERTQVMGSEKTCDDNISDSTITVPLKEYGDEEVDLSKENVSAKTKDISDCVAVIFSAPRGGSYYCTGTCSDGIISSCKFNKFSEISSAPLLSSFDIDLNIKDGFVTRGKYLKIDPSGNVKQDGQY